MSRFTRDDPRYFTDRPADHNPAGLFREGPQMAEPITSKLDRLMRARSPETAEGPLGARQRMARERLRKLSLLERQKAFVQAVFSPGYAPRTR